jgi:SAM-dependent methyltransferase
MSAPLTSARTLVRQKAMRWRAFRAERNARVPADVAPDEPLSFVCNLCGAAGVHTLAELSREALTCAPCGSNVRFRAIARLVTLELLGRATILPGLSPHRQFAGLGLSDAHAYALPLAAVFDYENTYFHTDPRLDITELPDERVGRYDFVIASDVFEHVNPPVGRAFVNARRMLRPGGKFIFTVPFNLEPGTREHFPNLHDWSMAEADGRWTLTNRTADGRLETFDDLVFHGGPGSTLEMRVFSRAALEREFREAGFARVRIADEPCLAYGIHWPEPWSVPMVAYAP